ncbi:hypothetical protein OAX11_04760 [Flavobacteriaceae bacterium]|nr:hypothetical protein [Flavobacteriaceae bacterium]
MKYLLNITLIVFFISCRTDYGKNKFENLTGTWRFQESTDEYITNDHRIIILEDSTYYTFSVSNGGGLIERGILSKNDSLIDERNFKYGLKKIDSNKIEIENHYSFYGDFTNTYTKSHYYPYKEELKKYLKIDSTRIKALGWWKLIKSKHPIELINYSGKYKEFTMQIKNNGTAHFYLDNYLDSVVNYGYRIREKGIDFRKGDVMGGGTKIFFESDTVMKMLMTPRSLDTLQLKKIYKIE